MNERRDPNWNRTVADVEQAVEACLKSLDKYEQAFAHVLAAQPVTVKPNFEARIADSAEHWTSTLKLAQKHADDVEELLAEQQNLWANWQDQYATWRSSLEQHGAKPTD